MGSRWNRLAEAVLTSTRKLCFEQKSEKYQSFLSENFQLFRDDFSIYLNRRAFIMNLGVPNEYSEQSSRLHRLILVVAEFICQEVCFVSLWLIQVNPLKTE